MRGDNINECVFLMFYNEMCQNMEDLHNSVNRYFLNEQCTLLHSIAWIKDPLKV